MLSFHNMCGISGIFSKKGNPKEFRNAIGKMNQNQGRRGPDDEGIFADAKNGLYFGHRRLAILDLSKAGHQPMGYNGNQLQIVYNGEIYNFLELRKELEIKGYKFKTKTDTEVILALYIEYGESAFSKLRGMFAFGLWDNKNQKIFLVKDRYGIKPLYYYSDAEKLIFASTVKALAKSGLVSFQKNPQALIGFLLFGSVPLPMTTLEKVYGLPAGHYLVRDKNGNSKLVKYYEPLSAFSDKKDVNFKEAVGETRHLLEESVNLHLISDAPLGIFLSGGLDSSAIAALAARNRKKPITTLSVIFDEKEFSEEHYSDLVAQKIGSDHKKIKITKQDFFDYFEEIFDAMDQPTVDGVNTFFIAKAAKEAGLKTVLSGLGSDEIFYGYSFFKKADFLAKAQTLPQLLKSTFDIFSLIGGRWAKLSHLKKSSPLDFYLSIRGLFPPKEIAKILDIDLNQVETFIKELSGSLDNDSIVELHPTDMLSYPELKFYLQNQLLKDTDFMSMRHSIEVRVPFLDHKLVEYLSGLPPRLKLDKAVNKPLLVEAVRDLLPEEIFSRKKMGFTFPFQKWLQDYPIASRFAGSPVGRQLSDYPIAKSHWSRSWANLILTKF